MAKVLEGVQFGIFLAFLIGPVFFTILQTSIERGFFYGAMVALGVSLSDILYVAICYFGLITLVNDPANAMYLAYGGGAVLIGFGTYHTFIKGRSRATPGTVTIKAKSPFRYVLKGFILNGFSPTVLFFWVATVSSLMTLGYNNGRDFSIFFGALLITVLLMDVLKAFLADKLRNMVTVRFIRLSNIILGIVLIGFGLKLILAQAGILTIISN
jgi:threonine/homoserine/homoserine lactone efflux protein